MRDRSWMSDAACVGYDFTGGIDPWFPNTPGIGARGQAQPAISICRECPVRVQCLAYARKHRELSGVWGGTLRNKKAIT